jgi:cephalosporin-C deacetylase-like acetyl esterase
MSKDNAATVPQGEAIDSVPSTLHTRSLPRNKIAIAFDVLMLLSLHSFAAADQASASGADEPTAKELPTAQMLVDYYHQMSVPKPFTVRRGDELTAHQAELKKKVLECVGLWPLPERVPLDVHPSPPLDHPWCTVRRIYYQLWPGVYSSGLLFMPKSLTETPAPAMLCPHGHWSNGNAHPEVQKRCLSFARLGYVTFSPTQNHYEDLFIGVSHQTLMIWNNMRALDYLQSLPEVDKSRIGAAGGSGGGLQTQMLAALDDRVRAATIAGLTCDFREIMFPDRHHCTCNHFPRVMQLTDHPEISALALPTPLQFLTMNDWTKNFRRDNFPTIQELYTSHGLADRVDCQYYNTPHSYDKEKREQTYWWMERWVRGRDPKQRVAEPDEIQTFPVDKIIGITVDVPENKGPKQLSRIYTEQRGYKAATLATPAQLQDYRRRMLVALRELLGTDAALPRVHNKTKTLGSRTDGELVIERVGYPSEGGIFVPAIVIRRKQAEGKLPAVIVLSAAGKESLLSQDGPASPRELAAAGSLVALPDVRCYGEMLSTGGKDEKLQRRAWQRNGIVWGRPVTGMACTDIQGVLDGLSARPDSDMTRVHVISRKSGGLAIATLFAAAIDARLTSADLDFARCCFENRNLPLVCSVLQHGDVLQWAALLADRQLTLRNVPPEAGDAAWLQAAFAAADNQDGLSIE